MSSKGPAHAPVFVVGTGRCGSTLLTNMIARHPRLASVSEFFSFITDLGGMIERSFPRHPIDGAAFWEIVAGRHPRQNLLLKHDLRMSEVLFPPKAEQADWAQPGVPALLLTTLPHLSTEPQQLLKKLEAELRPRPAMPVADHYRHLFQQLMDFAGADNWVERSGGTLRIVHRLVEQFPEARFIHIVRDGRNTALSMSRHIGFRMALICFQLVDLLGVDPFDSDDRSEADDLSDELEALLPENFTRESFEELDISASLCGHYWSGEVRDGLEVLGQLPRDRWMNLRYEDLCQSPHKSLDRIARFVGESAEDQTWISEAAGLVGRASSSFRSLSEREQSELEAACAPGFAALAQYDVDYTKHA